MKIILHTIIIQIVLFILSLALGLEGYGQIPQKEAVKTIKYKEKDVYTFSLNKGYQLKTIVTQKGADIIATVVDKKDRLLASFNSKKDTSKEELVQFIAPATSEYKLLIELSDSNLSTGGNYSIVLQSILSPKDLHALQQKEIEDEKHFKSLLKAHSYKLQTVQPNKGYKDLMHLKKILKDAQLVGLGESSHGTSEFFKVKHRVIEFLVKEMDYRSIYLEGSIARCNYLNDYVLYGKGDPDTATVYQGFVTWRTYEMRDLLIWVRNHNLTVSNDKKVKFIGFDLQITDIAWQEWKNFLKVVDPVPISLLDSVRRDYYRYLRLVNNLSDSAVVARTVILKRIDPLFTHLVTHIISHTGYYQQKGGHEIYERVLQNIRAIIQEFEWMKQGYGDKRNYYMASNIFYLLNLDKNEKAIVWAHNFHVSKSTNDSGKPNTMGGYLDQLLGNRYYAFALEFYKGSFQSRNLDLNNTSQDWDSISVDSPDIKSLPGYLHNLSNSDFYIDFKGQQLQMAPYFDRTFDMHDYGSVFSKKKSRLWPVFVKKLYDGIFFIHQSTSAKNFKTFDL